MEDEKYNNFINEINSYDEEELLGEDNGISDGTVFFLIAVMSGTLLMCIGLTIFVYLML